MAALDDDHLVVRVVYTGPPLAGKTQSVRALMPLLRGSGAEQAVVSPGEARGRTAFFDWADYEGGTYEGKAIRCQILSTPGQVALSDRRELLLRSADAVILVVASQEDATERATQCYEEMAPWLAEAGRDVPIRLILQCNKQDLPHAIPPEELSRTLGLPCGKDVYATSATTGKGLRAAFVAGVRNAVERARALVAKGIVLQRPDVFSGQDLFERMRRELAPTGSRAAARTATSAPPTSGASKSSSPETRQPRAIQPAAAARAIRPAVATTTHAARASNAAAGPASATSPSPRSSAKPSRSGLFPASSAPVRRPDAARESTGASVRGPKPSEPTTGVARKAAAPARNVHRPGVSSVPPRSAAARPARGGSEPRSQPAESVPRGAARAPSAPSTIRDEATLAAPSLMRALEPERELETTRPQLPERTTPPRRPAVMPASAWRSSIPDVPSTALPENEVRTLAPLPRRVVDPSVFGLETSAFVDESTESFRIPETPPGLQALINPQTEPSRPRPEPGDAALAAERVDSVRVPSLTAAASEKPNETPPIGLLPGPQLPGQARLPRAVWRRPCWRAIENQLSVHASALQDARGRWIGELAPGWFARTLRQVPDERAARRAFAEQVLRERQLATHLSRPRCSVLTEEGDGFWIWQVACRVPTLATILRPRLVASEPPNAMADALLDAALGYLDAHQRFVAAKVPLPLSPHALSFQSGKVVYSGLLPDPGAVFVEPAGNGYAAFQDALRKMWPDAPVDGSLVLTELESKAAGRLPEPLLEIIRDVVRHR